MGKHCSSCWRLTSSPLLHLPCHFPISIGKSGIYLNLMLDGCTGEKFHPLAVLGLLLESMILRVFFNLNDSIFLYAPVPITFLAHLLLPVVCSRILSDGSLLWPVLPLESQVLRWRTDIVKYPEVTLGLLFCFDKQTWSFCPCLCAICLLLSRSYENTIQSLNFLAVFLHQGLSPHSLWLPALGLRLASLELWQRRSLISTCKILSRQALCVNEWKTLTMYNLAVSG